MEKSLQIMKSTPKSSIKLEEISKNSKFSSNQKYIQTYSHAFSAWCFALQCLRFHLTTGNTVSIRYGRGFMLGGWHPRTARPADYESGYHSTLQTRHGADTKVTKGHMNISPNVRQTLHIISARKFPKCLMSRYRVPRRTTYCVVLRIFEVGLW